MTPAKTKPKAPARSRAPETRDAPGGPNAMSEAEIVVTDAVGRLMEFWGFKRNMGRVWSVMYLSPHPLTASDLRDLLQISSGAVSMTVAELMRWGVVKKVWVQGERRDFFVAEVALWRMISRVLGERERTEIAAAVESFERAIETLEARRKSRAQERSQEAEGHREDRARLDLQLRRVRALHELSKLGRTLLDALLATAKVDAEPLTRFLLGGSKTD